MESLTEKETALEKPQKKVSPDDACIHCGLPVGVYPIIENEKVFCCTGCALVYDTLATAGLDSTFYQLSQSDSQAIPSLKDRKNLDELTLHAFDEPEVLAEQATQVSEKVYRLPLFVEGMHCAACVWLIEQLPQFLKGVQEARVDLSRGKLTLLFNPQQTLLSEVAFWLHRVGYTISLSKQEIRTQQLAHEKQMLIKVGIAWALAGNIMLLAFAFYSGLSLTTNTNLAIAGRWASLVLTIPAVFYGGSEFFRKAWASILVAFQQKSITNLHIDVPISLGIGIGFIHSVWATISNQSEVWFDSITVLIAALLTARWLHLRSTRIAQQATDRLLDVIPKMARLFTKSDETTPQYQVVPTHQLEKGNTVVVFANEIIPVDGIVAEGKSSVNNAILTGESNPEKVDGGDVVQAGTTNLVAPLYIKVTAFGNDTRMGKLFKWIEDGQGTQASIVQLADKLSGFFVAVVLALALVTLFVWYVLAPNVMIDRTVALLVITCPCALGMATPLAMAIATGRAAKQGIYLKNSNALQLLTQIDTVVLDKTGTLTAGQLSLVNTLGSPEILQLGARLETQSLHPIARAILQAEPYRYVATETLPSEVKTNEFGLRGIVAGKEVVVGRPDWVECETAIMPIPFRDAITSYSEAGYTPVGVAIDGQFKGLFILGDKIREEAYKLVKSWQVAGKDIYILSGDHPATVSFIGKQLDLPAPSVLGHQNPEDKYLFIQELLKRGKKVVMIGDGVNDAGALRLATVGIAVDSQNPVSMLAADLFITSPGLAPIEQLFESAKKVMRVIKKNLGISLLYNSLGAIFAIIGWITPLVAAIAMPLSSIIVVGLSIGQRTFKNKKSF